MPEHVPNTTLYNRFLEPPNNIAHVPDSHGGRISGETLIGDGSTGWAWAPLPEDPPPGLSQAPVEYVPVEPVHAPAEMTVDELKDALRERNLPVSGSKDELVARLTSTSTEPEEG